MLQEIKARQIFRKNEHFLPPNTCAYQRVRNIRFFRKIGLAFFSWNTHSMQCTSKEKMAYFFRPLGRWDIFLNSEIHKNTPDFCVPNNRKKIKVWIKSQDFPGVITYFKRYFQNNSVQRGIYLKQPSELQLSRLKW